jgi:hypothetical protein
MVSFSHFSLTCVFILAGNWKLFEHELAIVLCKHTPFYLPKYHVTSYQYNSISYILVSMRVFYCFGANINNNFETICGIISYHSVQSKSLVGTNLGLTGNWKIFEHEQAAILCKHTPFYLPEYHVASYQYNSISYITISMCAFNCFGANKNNNFETICGIISYHYVQSKSLVGTNLGLEFTNVIESYNCEFGELE